MCFHFQSRGSNQSASKNQADNQKYQSCLKMQAYANCKNSQSRNANHVQADFKASINHSQCQYSTDQTSHKKEMQLGKSFSRDAFFNQDKKQYRMDNQWNLPVILIGKHYRIYLAHRKQEIIECNRNENSNYCNLYNYQIDFRILKVSFSKKEKNQNRINRYK